MSAQALNGNSTTGYAGYVGTISASNPNGNIPTRDASDVTRQLKERLIYAGFKSNTPTNPGTPNMNFQRPQLNPAGVNHIPGNSEWSWLPFGNQFRLSYLFGKLKSLDGRSTTTNVAGTTSVTTAQTASSSTSGVVLAPGVTSASGTTYGISGNLNPLTLGFAVGMAVTTAGYSTSANNGTFVINAIQTTGTTYIQVVTSGQSNQSSGTAGTITAIDAGGAFNNNGPRLPGKTTSGF